MVALKRLFRKKQNKRNKRQNKFVVFSNTVMCITGQPIMPEARHQYEYTLCV